MREVSQLLVARTLLRHDGDVTPDRAGIGSRGEAGSRPRIPAKEARTALRVWPLAGAIAPALVELPVVVSAAEEMPQLLPGTLHEMALALGIPCRSVCAACGVVVLEIDGRAAPSLAIPSRKMAETSNRMLSMPKLRTKRDTRSLRKDGASDRTLGRFHGLEQGKTI